jgi:hypothetical protein
LDLRDEALFPFLERQPSGHCKKVKKTTLKPSDVPQTIKVQRRGGGQWNLSPLHLALLVLLQAEALDSGFERPMSASPLSTKRPSFSNKLKLPISLTSTAKSVHCATKCKN